jgi:hypothetical protein
MISSRSIIEDVEHSGAIAAKIWYGVSPVLIDLIPQDNEEPFYPLASSQIPILGWPNVTLGQLGNWLCNWSLESSGVGITDWGWGDLPTLVDLSGWRLTQILGSAIDPGWW